MSGAIGHSLTFKQLVELIQKPAPTNEVNSDLSWEESISNPLSPPIPTLTHLSLSHPSPATSWSRLISFTKHTPALTHLSLAFWPVPSLNPNATTTVMASRYAKDVQYGGTNYYSHSLEGDFREAAEVLRRLAAKLPNLEYLDLTGCADWIRALRWVGDGDDSDRGVDWGSQWIKLHTLKAHSGLILSDRYVDLSFYKTKLTSISSPYADIVHLIQSHKEALATQEMLSWWMHPPPSFSKTRRKVWIDVEKDDWRAYAHLWNGDGEEERRKRSALDSLERIEKKGVGGLINGTEMGGGPGLAASRWAGPVVWDGEEDRVRDVERASVWEQ